MLKGMKVFVFGDSISYGAWDLGSGWAQRLRSDTDQQSLPRPQQLTVIYNLGIYGDSSDDVCMRFEAETSVRLARPSVIKDSLFLFAVGTNDSALQKGTQSHVVSEAQFKANISQLIQSAKAYSSNICFVGLTPCDEVNVEKSAQRLNWDEVYRNSDLKKYDDLIKAQCAKHQVDVIDLFKAFESNPDKDLFDDGLHPNSKGHALIYEQVKQYLSSNY